jgi:hypothetical protein
MDSDNDGRIDSKDLHAALEKVGWTPTAAYGRFGWAAWHLQPRNAVGLANPLQLRDMR